MKKTLREYFIKSHSNDPQIEKDIKLNSTLKLISYLILLFLLQGIGMTYLREYQFRRNMILLEPFLTDNRLIVMKNIGAIHFIENVLILVLVFLIGIASMYYCVCKYKKISEMKGLKWLNF